MATHECDAVIQHIENSTITAPMAVPVEPTEHPRGNGAFMVVRDGYSVKEIDGPKRGRRLHTFHDLASFAGWLNRHAAGNEERVEIVMNAVLDEIEHLGHTVAHLDAKGADGDVVECEIAQHPVWLAWYSIFGKNLDQLTLFEHVRCYRGSLGPVGETLLGALSQIKVTAGGTTELHVGPTGEIQFGGGDRRTAANVVIQPEYDVVTPIFDGVLARGADPNSPVEAEYRLRLFVSMAFHGQGEQKIPIFKLTCPDLAVVLKKALRDAREDLSARLHADFLVGFGVPKVAEVPLVESAAAPPSTPAPAPDAEEA